MAMCVALRVSLSLSVFVQIGSRRTKTAQRGGVVRTRRDRGTGDSGWVACIDDRIYFRARNSRELKCMNVTLAVRSTTADCACRVTVSPTAVLTLTVSAPSIATSHDDHHARKHSFGFSVRLRWQVPVLCRGERVVAQRVGVRAQPQEPLARAHGGARVLRPAGHRPSDTGRAPL